MLAAFDLDFVKVCTVSWDFAPWSCRVQIDEPGWMTHGSMGKLKLEVGGAAACFTSAFFTFGSATSGSLTIASYGIAEFKSPR